MWDRQYWLCFCEKGDGTLAPEGVDWGANQRGTGLLQPDTEGEAHSYTGEALLVLSLLLLPLLLACSECMLANTQGDFLGCALFLLLVSCLVLAGSTLQNPCSEARIFFPMLGFHSAWYRQPADAPLCHVCVCVVQVSAGRSVRALYGIIHVDNQLSDKVRQLVAWLRDPGVLAVP